MVENLKSIADQIANSRTRLMYIMNRLGGVSEEIKQLEHIELKLRKEIASIEEKLDKTFKELLG